MGKDRDDMALERQTEELALAKQRLRERIDRLTPKCGQWDTAIPALSFVRREEPIEATRYILEPSVCFIAQGSKRLFLCKDSYAYDANRYLITALDMPVVVQILEASNKRPYLSLMLKLDQRAISQLMIDSGLPSVRQQQPNRGMIVSDVTLPLLSAFLRLIDLIDEPESIPILSPLIQREILYRLLISEQGPYLRQIGTAGSQGYQVSRAIEWLKKNFSSQIRIEELAAFCHMSASSFHHHFRTMTSISPLQYRKLLRLQEARRLMLSERLNVADAAFRVGYESPSQFCREYTRMFNASPSRDVKALLSVGTNAQDISHKRCIRPVHGKGGTNEEGTSMGSFRDATISG